MPYTEFRERGGRDRVGAKPRAGAPDAVDIAVNSRRTTRKKCEPEPRVRGLEADSRASDQVPRARGIEKRVSTVPPQPTMHSSY